MDDNPYQSPREPSPRIPDAATRRFWIWIRDRVALVAFGLSIFLFIWISVTSAVLNVHWLTFLWNLFTVPPVK